MEDLIEVSVIIPIYNGKTWIDTCMKSIANQTAIGKISIEIVTFLDGCSSFESSEEDSLLSIWKKTFSAYNVNLIILKSETKEPKGVGFARNHAVQKSRGRFLCFQDIDDKMLPRRIELQYNLATHHVDSIIGSKFIRTPSNSTSRFCNWANSIPAINLETQIYTSNGPTIIMPTWFLHRNIFEKVGGFDEGGLGVPEDLIFFYKFLEMKIGRILRVDEVLLDYYYHENATTFSIKDETIFIIRLQHLLENVLSKQPWNKGFTIWNAGKYGRKFYRSLPDDVKKKVICFCDVDASKIGKKYKSFDPVQRKESDPIRIIDFKDAKPPVIICMKLDLTGGDFERNLSSKGWIEGKDYILFS